jgi:hypothetical protein
MNFKNVSERIGLFSLFIFSNVERLLSVSFRLVYGLGIFLIEHVNDLNIC